MQPEDFKQRREEFEGWPVKITNYRLGNQYVCQVEDMTVGPCLARFTAPTAEEAESQALSKARHLLRKTKRSPG